MVKNVAKKKFEFQTDDETRKRMSKIKSKDGKVERVIAKRLWRDGIHYRKNYSKLPGSPDIAITKYKIAVLARIRMACFKAVSSSQSRILDRKDRAQYQT